MTIEQNERGPNVPAGVPRVYKLFVEEEYPGITGALQEMELGWLLASEKGALPLAVPYTYKHELSDLLIQPHATLQIGGVPVSPALYIHEWVVQKRNTQDFIDNREARIDFLKRELSSKKKEEAVVEPTHIPSSEPIIQQENETGKSLYDLALGTPQERFIAFEIVYFDRPDILHALAYAEIYYRKSAMGLLEAEDKPPSALFEYMMADLHRQPIEFVGPAPLKLISNALKRERKANKGLSLESLQLRQKELAKWLNWQPEAEVNEEKKLSASKGDLFPGVESKEQGHVKRFDAVIPGLLISTETSDGYPRLIAKDGFFRDKNGEIFGEESTFLTLYNIDANEAKKYIGNVLSYGARDLNGRYTSLISFTAKIQELLPIIELPKAAAEQYTGQQSVVWATFEELVQLFKGEADFQTISACLPTLDCKFTLARDNTVHLAYRVDDVRGLG